MTYFTRYIPLDLLACLVIASNHKRSEMCLKTELHFFLQSKGSSVFQRSFIFQFYHFSISQHVAEGTYSESKTHERDYSSKQLSPQLSAFESRVIPQPSEACRWCLILELRGLTSIFDPQGRQHHKLCDH